MGNFKVRKGRGFTLEELKKAGIPRRQARTIGVSVDHRRHNHCEESLKANVDRLKEYKSKLMVLPLKNKVKKGDTPKSALKNAKITTIKDILPIKKPSLRVRARAITADEKSASAYRILRKARVDKKMFGKRKARAAAKEASKKDK